MDSSFVSHGLDQLDDIQLLAFIIYQWTSSIIGLSSLRHLSAFDNWQLSSFSKSFADQ
jgi:hypothetical protein